MSEEAERLERIEDATYKLAAAVEALGSGLEQLTLGLEAKLDELLALLRPKPVCDDEMAKIGELRVLIGSGLGALDAKVSDLKGWPWRPPVHDPNGGRR